MHANLALPTRVCSAGWHLEFDGNELEQVDRVGRGHVGEVSPAPADRAGGHARRPRKVKRLQRSKASQIVDFHLGGPINARAGTASYILQDIIQRHRWQRCNLPARRMNVRISRETRLVRRVVARNTNAAGRRSIGDTIMTHVPEQGVTRIMTCTGRRGGASGWALVVGQTAAWIIPII